MYAFLWNVLLMKYEIALYMLIFSYKTPSIINKLQMNIKWPNRELIYAEIYQQHVKHHTKTKK